MYIRDVTIEDLTGKYEIELAARSDSRRKQLLGRLKVDDGWSFSYFVKVEGIETEYGGLAAAVRAFNNA